MPKVLNFIFCNFSFASLYIWPFNMLCLLLSDWPCGILELSDEKLLIYTSYPFKLLTVFSVHECFSGCVAV